MNRPESATLERPRTILEPDGSMNGGDPKLAADECKILYRAMVAQRMLEERGVLLARNDKHASTIRSDRRAQRGRWRASFVDGAQRGY